MGFTYLLLVVDQEDSLWLTLTRSRLNLVDMVTACLKCSLEKTPEFGGHGDGLLKVFSGKDLPSQRHLCIWVWKRLALSGVKWNAVQSFLIMEECLRYSFIMTIIS